MTDSSKKPNTYVFIGGGAAGYFAAINSAEKHPTAQHILLEATHRPMTKIKLSGGGRCNVTHHCFDIQALVKNYPRGSKELLGALTRFQPQDTIKWFESRGVPLKVEADNRMFPTTNSSETIINCLNQEVAKWGVEVRKASKVRAIQKQDSRFIISIHNAPDLEADRVVLATGSVPAGYELAASLGHNIIDPVPSLFTFNCTEPVLIDLMGTSFKKVSVILEIKNDNGKKTWQQNGPLLITHWGLSGPAVLKLSAFAARELHAAKYQANLYVNWLGDLKYEEALAALSLQKEENPKQSLANSTIFDLTKRFFNRLISLAIPDKQFGTWADLNKKNLQSLAQMLTRQELKIHGKGQFKEEFVSCGGIDLKEVNFKSMESKICSGLFFAGEILNIDGITGGFNFQNAWTTAWIVAQNIDQ